MWFDFLLSVYSLTVGLLMSSSYARNVLQSMGMDAWQEEYCCRTDIDITDLELLDVLCGVADSVGTLHHEFGILHRDLAARNVLLNAENRPRLCDFGLSCQHHRQWQCDQVPINSWPPEALLGGGEFGFAGDTWGFGMVRRRRVRARVCVCVCMCVCVCVCVCVYVSHLTTIPTFLF
jgi:serine/threonine protein kinase